MGYIQSPRALNQDPPTCCYYEFHVLLIEMFIPIFRNLNKRRPFAMKKPLRLKSRELPLFIKYKGKKETKEFVLRANKDKTGIFLNKKEY